MKYLYATQKRIRRASHASFSFRKRWAPQAYSRSPAVVPFCTSGGSGFFGSIDTIRELDSLSNK